MITAISPDESRYIVVKDGRSAIVIGAEEMDCSDIALSTTTDDREMALEVAEAWNVTIPYLNNSVLIIVV